MKKPTSQIMESTRKGDSSIQETHFDSDPVKTAGSIASDSARDASSMDPKKPIVRGVSKDQMNFESRRPNGDGSLKFNGYESNKRDSNSVGLERKEEVANYISPLKINFLKLLHFSMVCKTFFLHFK